jgi:hypothetical protein
MLVMPPKALNDLRIVIPYCKSKLHQTWGSHLKPRRNSNNQSAAARGIANTRIRAALSPQGSPMFFGGLSESE